ncbi:MAG: ribonucleoside-diphosphate reductase subunit alpha [Candidatus Eremiobacteraeota bacterium]|nr:ribonucleoside-diphosphate reductase subunit alpha [Candidatus Eremiobacteraeota bacterium]MCW5867151.1 ribonucleoside-diphosphate reductase subunit alpha [Candidatus Eremiobacteraeota bacterium]
MSTVLTSASPLASPAQRDSHSPGCAANYRVIRRDGAASAFDPSKISLALSKAFLAVEGTAAAASQRIHETVEELTSLVVTALTRRSDGERLLHIEDVQDQVELALMRAGHHKVARAYVLYREERSRRRDSAAPEPQAFDDRLIRQACEGLEDVAVEAVVAETRRNLYQGISEEETLLAQIMAARTLIELEPNYTYVAARLLNEKLRLEAHRYLGCSDDYFLSYVRRATELGMLDPELSRFDLARLSAALKPERDRQFQFLGLQTLYDRYLLHHDGVRYELPQAFFMRVAMGLALREVDREACALEFYEVLSRFDFMASTPTLFNAGTCRPQLSSCFLTSVPDDLHGIFKCIQDNAMLSKYAGGLGNSWTRVRGLGAHIQGTNGKSQGVVPFLKVANDTAIAVNQGGKRKGAVCAYLETWHIDLEEFLDLRKNTGDDRRRTHDMNTAHWVPDLFLERVEQKGEWTLFSPDETPDLHDLYGDDFRQAYEGYEARAQKGEIRVYRRVAALDLWRKMLTMLFETGHPWITFKDACNLRSPQQHCGVIHSSNLCTEITLNTSDQETAVCNLGSLNLVNHLTPAGLDRPRLARTVETAVRMLDNVIDINFYTIPEARRSNLQHRPVGLGLMGFQDALQQLGWAYSSEEARRFADESMEFISYEAISASTRLAQERGRYPSFEGSLWSQGVLPIHSLERLPNRELNRDRRLDWDELAERVRRQGMRNSNVLAIAPTATISNICGVSQSIEPAFQNLYVKSNMSGDFTVVNHYLVRALKQRGLWDQVMVSDLKYYDGRLGAIERVPEDLKQIFATAFELEPEHLVEAAALRQKWIDQAQSLNLYLSQPSGRKLDELYRLAWRRGLKTTYYLRSQAATQVEKSTLRGTDGKLNRVSANFCSLENPDCEACQ